MKDEPAKKGIEPIGGHWPPELFEKVIDNFQELSGATSLTAIARTISALSRIQHLTAVSQIKNKFLIIDLTESEI